MARTIVLKKGERPKKYLWVRPDLYKKGTEIFEVKNSMTEGFEYQISASQILAPKAEPDGKEMYLVGEVEDILEEN
jgi:hypothetical protein